MLVSTTNVGLNIISFLLSVEAVPSWLCLQSRTSRNCSGNALVVESCRKAPRDVMKHAHTVLALELDEKGRPSGPENKSGVTLKDDTAIARQKLL